MHLFKPLPPLWLSLLLWGLAILLAWPVGDFPLDDDWAYAEAVKHLVDTGQYWVSDWPAMTLFTQILWGSLFVELFGFSFHVLRASTLVLALLGILALHASLKQLGWPPYAIAIGLLAVIFNPIYFELSLTFMTDVPFFSLMAIALYFYLQAFREERLRWWAAATLFSSLMILLRQPALLLPAAMGAARWLSRPSGRNFAVAVLSTGAVYGALQAYVFWQVHNPTGLPGAFGQPGKLLRLLTPDYLAWQVYRFAGLYLMYIGGLLLPLLLLSRWPTAKRSGKALAALGAGLAVLLIYWGWGQGLMGNTLHRGGLGTIALPGNRAAGWPAWPEWWGVPLSGYGIAAALLLSVYVVLHLVRLPAYWAGQRRNRARHPLPQRGFQLGLLLFLMAYCSFLLINVVHFDRYLLPVLLCSLLLVVPVPQGRIAHWRIRTAAGIVLLLAAFSIGGTHDYFAWNRARWSALNAALEAGIPPASIDGGFEFNGWYRTAPQGPRYPYRESWWFVAEDDYAVSFAPYANYRAKAAFPFQRWLPAEPDTLFLLERPAWSAVDTFRYEMEPGRFGPDTPFGKMRASEFQSLIKASFDGSHAYRMDTGQAYGLTHQFFPVAPHDEFQFVVWAHRPPNGLGLVNAAPAADDFHHSHTLWPTGNQRGQWKEYAATMRLPGTYPSDTLSAYFWKRNQDSILLDDFRIIWKQTR